MVHDIPKPDISPAFNIDDIHKIREWNYERFKDATREERRVDIEYHASITRNAIEERRRLKGVFVSKEY